MSNWGTMAGTIMKRCNRNETQLPAIKRAICDAIAKHRGDNFPWTQGAIATFTLTTGQGSYPLADFGISVIAFMGQKLTILYNGDANDSHPLEWASRERMFELYRGVADTGLPDFWSFWGEQFEVYPAPDAEHEIQFPYIADAGTPIYTGSISGSTVTYTFYEPDGVTVMTDAYGTGAKYSPWFDQRKGYQMIAWYAEYLLWTTDWQASDGQDQRALMRYTEAEAQARMLASLQPRAKRIQAYDPDKD
jgi:hypothetical protein